MTRQFSLSWDYRCPFARIAHKAAIQAVEAGRDWDVRFLAFSLDQARAEEGTPPVWERPAHERGSGVLPLLWGIAVRDRFPELFPQFHVAVFEARFADARKTGNEAVLREIAAEVGLDADLVAKEVADGWPLERLAEEHTLLAVEHAAFGVPTAVVGDEAVFFRLVEQDAVDDLERVIDLVDWTRLNEFKRTRIYR